MNREKMERLLRVLRQSSRSFDRVRPEALRTLSDEHGNFACSCGGDVFFIPPGSDRIYVCIQCLDRYEGVGTELNSGGLND